MNKDRINEWSILQASNFILLKPDANLNSFTSEFDQFKNIQNEADVLRPIKKLSWRLGKGDFL